MLNEPTAIEGELVEESAIPQVTLNLFGAGGDSVVEFEDPRMTAVPETNATHIIIPHSYIVEQVEYYLDVLRIKVRQRCIVLTNKGSRMFVMWEIEDKMTGVSGIIAAKSSHDKSTPVSFSSGIGVWVCANLQIGGEYISHTRHTMNVYERLPNTIRKGLKGVIAQVDKNYEEIEQLQQSQLRSHDAGRLLLLDMARNGMMTDQEMCRAQREWLEPAHEEHAQWGHSYWQLLNACTEAIKPVSNRGYIDTAILKTPPIYDLLRHEATGAPRLYNEKNKLIRNPEVV